MFVLKSFSLQSVTAASKARALADPSLLTRPLQPLEAGPWLAKEFGLSALPQLERLGHLTDSLTSTLSSGPRRSVLGDQIRSELDGIAQASEQYLNQAKIRYRVLETLGYDLRSQSATVYNAPYRRYELLGSAKKTDALGDLVRRLKAHPDGSSVEIVYDPLFSFANAGSAGVYFKATEETKAQLVFGHRAMLTRVLKTGDTVGHEFQHHVEERKVLANRPTLAAFGFMNPFDPDGPYGAFMKGDELEAWTTDLQNLVAEPAKRARGEHAKAREEKASVLGSLFGKSSAALASAQEHLASGQAPTHKVDRLGMNQFTIPVTGGFRHLEIRVPGADAAHAQRALSDKLAWAVRRVGALKTQVGSLTSNPRARRARL